MDRMLPKSSVVVVIFAALALAPAANAQDVSDNALSSAATNVATETQMSDEFASSTWAFVRRRTVARTEPSYSARRVKTLTTRTPDRTSELVLVLKEIVRTDGAVWAEVRLPMRPANKTGWVIRRDLWRYHTVNTSVDISINKKLLSVYRAGKKIFSTRVGVGQRRWPTPKGSFYIREKLVPTEKGGVYGPFAFGLSAYSKTLTDWPGGGMIGIHGTNQPKLIPGRISHGCIRVKNRRILKLKRLVSVGTPVTIH